MSFRSKTQKAKKFGTPTTPTTPSPKAPSPRATGGTPTATTPQTVTKPTTRRGVSGYAGSKKFNTNTAKLLPSEIHNRH